VTVGDLIMVTASVHKEGVKDCAQKSSELNSLRWRPSCPSSLSRSFQLSVVSANLRCFRPIVCWVLC